MKEFFFYLLKSGICITIFLSFYCMFLRRATFFSFNRFYLISGLLASFILPLFRFTYTVHLDLPFWLLYSDGEMGKDAQAVPQSGFISIWHIFLVVYISGIMILLLIRYKAFVNFRRLIKYSKTDSADGFNIVDDKKIESPYSIFNYIFYNSENLSTTEKETILKHEQTHIQQKHWMDLLCGQCALMLQWFNPFMWMYIYYLKQNHEYLADKAVLDGGIPSATYQAVLINQRFRAQVFSFGNSFNYSNPINRLTMMKKNRTKQWKKLAIIALFPAFGTFYHVFAETRYEFNLTGIDDSMFLMDSMQANIITVLPDTVPVAIKGKVRIDVKQTHAKLDSIEHPHFNLDKSRKLDSISQVKTTQSVNINIHTPPLVEVNGKDFNGKIEDINDTDSILVNVNSKPLSIFIDRKTALNSGQSEIDSLINPQQIESIEVYKGIGAIDKYGEENKNGVIRITLKNEN